MECNEFLVMLEVKWRNIFEQNSNNKYTRSVGILGDNILLVNERQFVKSSSYSTYTRKSEISHGKLEDTIPTNNFIWVFRCESPLKDAVFNVWKFSNFHCTLMSALHCRWVYVYLSFLTFTSKVFAWTKSSTYKNPLQRHHFLAANQKNLNELMNSKCRRDCSRYETRIARMMLVSCTSESAETCSVCGIFLRCTSARFIFILINSSWISLGT